jgi:hypothetical protein
VYQHTGGRDLKLSYEWVAFAASLPGIPLMWRNQSASFQLFKGRCIIQGLNVNNGNAAGQTIILFNGEDATGDQFHQSFIGNGQNQLANFGTRGVLCDTGVYCQLFGGPWVITAYMVPLWHNSRTPPGV